jgi:FlaA1/EpsC-like NDP-sugar epimerase
MNSSGFNQVLITGATGAIGIQLLKTLRLEEKLKGVSVFARDSKKNRKILADFSGDITIHFGDITHKDDLVNS